MYAYTHTHTHTHMCVCVCDALAGTVADIHQGRYTIYIHNKFQEHSLFS